MQLLQTLPSGLDRELSKMWLSANSLNARDNPQTREQAELALSSIGEGWEERYDALRQFALLKRERIDSNRGHLLQDCAEGLVSEYGRLAADRGLDENGICLQDRRSQEIMKYPRQLASLPICRTRGRIKSKSNWLSPPSQSVLGVGAGCQ
jgi:hypothetical protein